MDEVSVIFHPMSVECPAIFSTNFSHSLTDCKSNANKMKLDFNWLTIKYREISLKSDSESEKIESVGLTLRHLNSIELWASQESLHLSVTTTISREQKKTYLRASHAHKRTPESSCIRCWLWFCAEPSICVHRTIEANRCVLVCVRFTRQMEAMEHTYISSICERQVTKATYESRLTIPIKRSFQCIRCDCSNFSFLSNLFYENWLAFRHYKNKNQQIFSSNWKNQCNQKSWKKTFRMRNVSVATPSKRN